MGVGVFPIFKSHSPSAKFDSDGKALLSELSMFDEFANSYGLQSLGRFLDNRPVPDDFEGDPDELDEILGDSDEWFPVVDGLQTVEALTAKLKTTPKAKSQFREPQQLIEELKALAACLRSAAPGALFRLEVG